MARKLNNYLFDIVHTWEGNDGPTTLKFEDTAWGVDDTQALARLKTNTINSETLSEYTFECVGIIA